MAIVFGGKTTTTGTGSTFTVTPPTGIVSGDAVFMAAVVASQNISSGPTNGTWTDVTDGSIQGFSGAPMYDLWWVKYAGEASYTFTLGGSSAYAAVFVAYGNVNTAGTLIDQNSSTARNSGSTSWANPDPGGTATAHEGLLSIYFTSETTASSFTAPSGMTLRASALGTNSQVWFCDGPLDLGAAGTDPGSPTATGNTTATWAGLTVTFEIGTGGGSSSGGGPTVYPYRRWNRTYLRM